GYHERVVDWRKEREAWRPAVCPGEAEAQAIASPLHLKQVVAVRDCWRRRGSRCSVCRRHATRPRRLWKRWRWPCYRVARAHGLCSVERRSRSVTGRFPRLEGGCLLL